MDYYETNARSFVEATLNVDMEPLYRHFLPLLPKPAHILDVGCGSGRDSKFFCHLGHHVTAFDASVRIAAHAQQQTGLPIIIQRVQDLCYQDEFDGIWASASLLHVPVTELPDVFRRLAQALKSGGILYCSFKYGQGEHRRQGRRFTDFDEAGLTNLLSTVEGLAITELWVSADRRPEREQECWLNALLLADRHGYQV